MSVQKIVSKKVELPVIYLVENQEDYNTLPKGIPYIIGSKEDLKFITIFLEFQVLYKSCLKTGLKIKWLDMLSRIGYKSNLRQYTLQSGGEYWNGDKGTSNVSVDQFIEDQYLVNFDKLAELKILPVWLDDIRSSIEANIIDEVIFDPTAFNKQMGMNIGTGAMKHNKKNLLILDISGSIPDAIRLTIIKLSRLMSKKFYADVIFTGGQTIFLEYEEVMTKDIDNITSKISRNNEGAMYKEIVEVPRDYNTCICFGDDDSPMGYNNCGTIKNRFTVETLYSLHTDTRKSDKLTGYCKVFRPYTTIKVKDWVTTLDK